MRFDSDSQAAPARPSRRAAWRSAALALTLCLGLMVGGSVAKAAQPPAEHGQAHDAAAGEHADGGTLPVIAKVFNFAVLAGVLFYFLRTPIATYLASRDTQIRQDLMTAAEMRAAATKQLADIDARMKSLPAELDALRAQGAADVEAERARIADAAAVERSRLLEHTRREIDMQLRIARRDLTEYAAQLAVDVAHARIVRTITPEDQLRLVDRYATQLKEAR
jgi:F-type H+-transporting ATPase subunit b